MKTKIILVTLLLVAGFLSCKKSSNDQQPKTTQEKLQGIWKPVSTVINDYYNNASHADTTYWNAADYIDFRSDGKVYQYESASNSYDTSAYGIIDDSKIWIINSTYVFEIKTFTDTDLQLYRKEIHNTTDYTESTARVKR